VQGSMGCFENLLIEKAILKDANKRKRKKYPSCPWVDTKIAFCSMSHSWLLAVLRDHELNKTMTSLIESIIRKWKLKQHSSRQQQKDE